MRPANKTRFTRIMLLGTCLLLACENKDQLNSRCLNRVAEQCGPIAQRECDLSGSSSPSELERCIPYSTCKNLTMLSCLSQQ